MIKSLVILAVSSTINTSHSTAPEGTILNFGQTAPPGFFQDFINQIPYSDHLVIDTPGTGVKTGWGVESGGIDYQWTTDDNWHIKLGMNLGINDQSNFGVGPTIGFSYKFQ